MDHIKFVEQIVAGEFDESMDRFSYRNDWVDACLKHIVTGAHAEVAIDITDNERSVKDNYVSALFKSDVVENPFNIQGTCLDLHKAFVHVLMNTAPSTIPAIYNKKFVVVDDCLSKPQTTFKNSNTGELVDVPKYVSHANGRYRTLNNAELIFGTRITEFSGDRN
tara:strand:+ start:40 stop:534 length:495 start_codon:yes stop_codon:yes gene_type:complete